MIALLGHVPGPAWVPDWFLPAVVALVPGLLYAFGVDRLLRRGRHWSTRRSASFFVGATLLVVALLPAVEEAATATARGHMAQHLLLGMFAPMLLVFGAPVTLLLGATSTSGRARLHRLLRTRPLRIVTNLWVVTLLYAGGLFVLYLTPLLARSLEVDLVHLVVHLHLFATGYLFAWVVAGPDPARHRPALPWRLAALVVASASHALLAKLLYSRAPSWPPGTTFERRDLEVAAQWMYYGGHLAELVLLIAVLGAWYRSRVRVRPALAPSVAAAGP